MFVDVAQQTRRRLCMQVVRGSTLFFFFQLFLPIGWFHFICVAPLQLREVLR